MNGPCIGGDPLCPCQDGDMCHYQGPNAWPISGKKRKHWISCNKFTVEVETDARDVVIRAAPIVRRFQGQPLANLLSWASDLGGLKHEVLDGP
jgi:hypothetical protein